MPCRVTVNIRKLHKVSISLGKVKLIKGDNPKYEGPYMVTPKAFEPTILDTKNKLLVDDIAVLEIPYFETDNEFGNTVYIGSEVETNG